MKAKVPTADLTFEIDPNTQKIMDAALRLPLDDRYARSEWGWKHEYDLEAIVDDFLRQVNQRSAAYTGFGSRKLGPSLRNNPGCRRISQPLRSPFWGIRWG